MLEVDDATDIEVGTVLAPAERTFSAEDVAAFCALSGDGAAIHAPDAAVQIVPGAMLLAAVASYLQGALRVGNADRAVLAKIDGARFQASLAAGSLCRFEGTVRRVRRLGAATYVTVNVTCVDIAAGEAVMSLDVTDAYVSGDDAHI